MIPRDDLASLVHSYWEVDGEFPPSRERELPRGDISIMFNLAGRHTIVDRPTDRGAFDIAWITGLHSSAFVTECAGRAWLCGVRLTPEGAYRVLGPDVARLAGRFIAFDSYLGPEALCVVEAVRSRRTPGERLLALDSFVCGQVRRHHAARAALAWAAETIRRDAGAVSIQGLAEAIGWSRTHFHAAFSQDFGLAPSAYRRLRRFDAALRALEPTRSVRRLTEIAHALGFSDQAHFANDFRAIAGIPASAYLRRRTNAVDYGLAAET